jgi:type VI secretion system secreted protein Hcp
MPGSPVEEKLSIPKLPTGDITSLITSLITKIISGSPPKQENRGTAFLEIEGIQAESQYDGHKDEMEIFDFHWTVAQPRAAAASGGGATTTERAHFGDLSVYKAVDKSTPELAQACASGRHLPKAIFQVCRAGGETQKYLEYTLHDVVITSVRTGGRGYGERVPLEEVSLSYGKIEWEYIPLKVESGGPSGIVKKSWNLKTNKES